MRAHVVLAIVEWIIKGVSDDPFLHCPSSSICNHLIPSSRLTFFCFFFLWSWQLLPYFSEPSSAEKFSRLVHQIDFEKLSTKNDSSSKKSIDDNNDDNNNNNNNNNNNTNKNDKGASTADKTEEKERTSATTTTTTSKSNREAKKDATTTIVNTAPRQWEWESVAKQLMWVQWYRYTHIWVICFALYLAFVDNPFIWTRILYYIQLLWIVLDIPLIFPLLLFLPLQLCADGSRANAGISWYTSGTNQDVIRYRTFIPNSLIDCYSIHLSTYTYISISFFPFISLCLTSFYILYW